jgi:Ras-related protein Rab-6A
LPRIKHTFLSAGQIWDTAGQERYKSLSGIYYRNVDVVLFIFALNDRSSFQSLDHWFETFSRYKDHDSLVYLVGNKTDSVDWLVDQSEATQWGDAHNAGFFLTSALSGDGIREMFARIGRDILREARPPNYSAADAMAQPVSEHFCC